jgi:5-formyltetrahydrofolate cyclo-ligase
MSLEAKHAPGRAREDAAHLLMKPSDPLQEKHQLRAVAHLRRLHQQNGERLSEMIFERIVRLPQYAQARTVLSYVSFRSEVSTRAFFQRMWADRKQVVVPYCMAQHLELFCFSGFDDLVPGMLGILEPKPELRGQDQRRANVGELDLLVIPGLAFDRQGGRIGYGKGYFDRLLPGARPDALLAAVAFECQLFEAVPMQSYDVRVDAVVTENEIYRRSLPRCQSRPS